MEGTPVSSPAAHLAQAVLPQSLKTASFVAPMDLPVTMGQLTRLVSGITTTASNGGLLATQVQTAPPSPRPAATLTEISSSSPSSVEDEALASPTAAHEATDDTGYSSVDPDKHDSLSGLSSPTKQPEWVSARCRLLGEARFRGCFDGGNGSVCGCWILLIFAEVVGFT